MSKDSLVKGTAILALAAFVARILGVVQRIPLLYLIGYTGMATYGIAFNIYTPLLTVATAGIPSALSKLVSERMELKQYAEADRIYSASIRFAAATGILMTIALFFLAPYYAERVGDPDATLAIRALAPALLLFPIIAIMRGYFIGRRTMLPNGLSQIIEQVARLITAVGLAWILLAADWGHVWAVAGASFGGVMGSVGALLVLVWYYVKLRRKDAQEGIREEAERGRAAAEAESYGKIYSRIFRVSVPIVLFSLAVPLIYFIDSSTVIRLLEGSLGEGGAKEMLGILTGPAQSLAGIPIILAIALSQSIVPIVSSAFARKDMDQVREQASKALRLSVVTGLPVALAIALAARPINDALFGGEPLVFLGQNTPYGIIAFLTITALFQIVMQTAGSILMGLGEMRTLILAVVIGIAVKLAGSFALAPFFGIYGIMSATAACFIAMMVQILWVLGRRVDYVVFSPRRWFGLGLTTIILCGAGIGLEQLTHQWIDWFHFFVNNMINAALVGGAVVGLYLVLLVVTRVYTREDAAELPAPLRRLLAKLGRLAGRRGGTGMGG